MLKFRDRLPAAWVLGGLNYKAIALGFFSIQSAWQQGPIGSISYGGRYWYWDPAEISSLAMWLMYAFILHGRYQRWCGER